jgi:hypothetical protein
MSKLRPAGDSINDLLELFLWATDIVDLGKVQQVLGGDVPRFAIDLHLMHPCPFTFGGIVRETVVIGRCQFPLA